MDSKRVREKFDQLPPKRKQVLLKVLADESKPKIALELCDGSEQAVQQHLRQLYKDFHIQGDRERKLPALIQLFVRCMPELINNRVPGAINDLLDDRGTAKLHRESVEPVKALASQLSFQQKVDYTRMQNLLKDEKWREADKETLAVMLKISGREQEGWLTTEHIENFPCQDLQTIDQLWKKYSNERFGLSIQKRIWESVGGTPDADYRTVCYFGNHVGWRRSGRWLSYGNRTFNHLSPKGHLPYLCFQIKLPDLNLLEFAELFNFEEGLERVRDFGVNRLFNLVQKCSL